MWLEYYSGKTTDIQFGSDGGASVADGVLTDNGYALIARHRPSTTRITLNGDVLAPGELAILPPGGHFIFAAEGPRTWFSFWLPRELVEGLSPPHSRLVPRLRQKRPCIVPTRPELMQALISEVDALRATHRYEDTNGAQNGEARVMELASLILSDCGAGRRADLHVAVRVQVETTARLDQIVIDHAQRPEIHPRFVVVIGKTEMVFGIKPIVLKSTQSLFGEYTDHDDPAFLVSNMWDVTLYQK